MGPLRNPCGPKARRIAEGDEPGDGPRARPREHEPLRLKHLCKAPRICRHLEDDNVLFWPPFKDARKVHRRNQGVDPFVHLARVEEEHVDNVLGESLRAERLGLTKVPFGGLFKPSAEGRELAFPCGIAGAVH